MKRFLDELAVCLKEPQRSAAVRAVGGMTVEALLGLDRNSVYLDKDNVFSAEQRKTLGAALWRLAAGEPIQYVLGSCEFCAMRFRVAPPVLIPRPETEELVGWIVGDMAGRKDRFLDVGTGSGCVAVSLARALPGFEAEAWDILPEALSLARENSRLNAVKVQVLHRDLFKAVDAEGPAFSFVVSNPPYVCEEEAARMEANVLDYESPTALFVPDDDALVYYRALAALGRKRLVSGGALYVEINERFGRDVCRLFKDAGYAEVTLRRDLFGRDRMVKAVLY